MIRIEIEEADGKISKRIIETGWRQDCLRHTFASHFLPVFGAERTLEELGHGNYEMLLGHYRKLVTKPESDAFWSLTPEEVRKQNG